MPVAEILAGIALVKSSVDFIKSNIDTCKDIGELGSAIDNLSNDMTYVVVLYAAIKSAEALLAEEEDAELYIPMITGLKQDYAQALQTIGANARQPGGQGEG